MSNPLKALIGQTAIYGLSSIIGRFLNYLLTPLWTSERVFSKEQYGIITEMYAYVAFLVILLSYGMETSFFRFANKDQSKANKVFSTALISLCTTTIVFWIISLSFNQNIANWLMYPEHQEYVIWFALIVGLDAISSIPLAKLRLEQKALKFALVNFANIGVNIGLNLFFLAYCKLNYDAGTSNTLIDWVYNPEIGVGYVFIANLIASLVKFVLLIPQCNFGAISFEFPLLKQMLKYAYPLLFVGLAGVINETLDRILLKKILVKQYGLETALGEIGIYGANYKLAILIVLFIQAYRYAAEPFFFNQEKQANAKQNYIKLMHYFIIIVSFMFLVVSINLESLKYFINNPALWAGLDIVPILLLANIFLGIYYNQSIWYKLSEKTKYGALIAIVGALITIIFNVILIPFIGFRGSAWATLLCYISMVILSYHLGKKHYPIHYKIKKGSFYILLSLVLFALTQLIPTTNFSVTYWIKIVGCIGLFLWLTLKMENVSLKEVVTKIKKR